MNKQPRNYPIVLEHLSSLEQMTNNEDFKDYKLIVALMLNFKECWIYEEDIIKQHEKENTIVNEADKLAAIIRTHPHRYALLGTRQKNADEPTQRFWVDLWTPGLIITPEFPFYDSIFCYTLKHTDLLELDGFLSYTLTTYYENDLPVFSRFVKLSIRKYENKLLLDPEIIETVNEWITEQAAVCATENVDKKRLKGIPHREAGDNLTKLNQEQTALLFAYLQKGKLILKDEYLNNSQAADAFFLLTGYSPNALRQSFGKAELERIAKKSQDDFYNFILNFYNLVKTDFGGKK